MTQDKAANQEYLELCKELVGCIMDFMKDGEDIAEFGRKRRAITARMEEREAGIAGDAPDDSETADEPEAEAQEPPTFASDEEEVKWYLDQAEKGDVGALYNLGVRAINVRAINYPLRGEPWREKPWEQVEKWFRVKAEQGNADAQYILGEIYDNREESKEEKNRMKLRYLVNAAKQGIADAQYRLGEIYGQGLLFMPVSNGLAEEWFRKSADSYRDLAEEGDVLAQYRLGRMYHIGRGVLMDATRAARWFRKAAEQGHPDAQKRLGEMYCQGDGVPVNKGEGEEWFSKAADGYRLWIERDWIDQRYKLWSQEMRFFAEEELRELVKWNWPNAQYNLGALYEAGLVGEPKHRRYAVNWYRKAAEQGHKKAKEALERLGR